MFAEGLLSGCQQIIVQKSSHHTGTQRTCPVHLEIKTGHIPFPRVQHLQRLISELHSTYPMIFKRLLYDCRPKGSSWVDTTSCVANLQTISEENTTCLSAHAVHCTIRPQQDGESIYQINKRGNVLIYSLQRGVPALQTILWPEVQIHGLHVFCR